MQKISKEKYCRGKHNEKPKITTCPIDKMTPAPELADEIVNPDSQVRYKRGKFLGKV